MGKISQVSAKYIIHASFQIDGTVDKPDIIGAVFGQTEGLLGSDLELRELQRNGRIGRIEVNSDVKGGKTSGSIQIPSSLDKSETCIVAAAIEIIQRIGPCNAKIQVQKIEDIRVSKRNQVVSRAKELLKELVDSVMPDSQEIADEVAYSVRVMEITTYGDENLPAGPTIDESDEVVVVEGRADVLNLLKNGFKNVIGMNGTSVPQSIIKLSQEKTITLFVDGDRGGDLIMRELGSVGEIDFVTKAPDGKEVEELTKKEINKALRSKIAYEQAKLDLKTNGSSNGSQRDDRRNSSRNDRNDRNTTRGSNPRFNRDQRDTRMERRPMVSRSRISDDEKSTLKKMGEELVGTKGAFVLDESMNILGKVPVAELNSTIRSLGKGIHAIILDGDIDKDVAFSAEKAGVKIVVGSDNKVKTGEFKLTTMTASEL